MTTRYAALVLAALLAPAVAAAPAPPTPVEAPQAAAAPAVPPMPAAPEPSEPWYGFVLGDATDGGVQVVAVVPGGPADRAAIRPGDLLIRVNGVDVTDRGTFHRVVAGVEPGDRVVLTVLRDGKSSDAVVRVAGRRPDVAPWEMMMQQPGALSLLGSRRPGVAGVSVEEIPRELRLHYGAPADAGVLVTRVESGSPGFRAGIRVGDVLVRAAGEPIVEAGDVASRLEDLAGGVSVEGMRSGRPFRVTVAPARPVAGGTPEERVRRLEALVDAARSRLAELERELDAARLAAAPR